MATVWPAINEARPQSKNGLVPLAGPAARVHASLIGGGKILIGPPPPVNSEVWTFFARSGWQRIQGALVGR